MYFADLAIAATKTGNHHISGIATSIGDGAISLTQQMRRRTTQLHAAAERTGIVAALLRGQLTRSLYALYLRNLLPAYQAMEQALRQQCGRGEFAGLAQPSVYRAASIVADLETIIGDDWAESLPVLPAAERYAERVRWAGRGAMLIAHCYTRYLGDLSGGQQLGKCLTRTFGPDFRALAFNRFPDIPDLHAFRSVYRAILDQAGERLADTAAVVEEAAVAFRFNIRLSRQVHALRHAVPA